MPIVIGEQSCNQNICVKANSDHPSTCHIRSSRIAASSALGSKGVLDGVFDGEGD
jgi:hypothetical protein